MSGLCIIIAGGDVKEQIVVPEGSMVICADCGLRHARAQGIRPHLVVGDFDSAPCPADVPALTHPPEKDDTDTSLAVRCGAERGCTEFHIYGAFGGARIDHSLANLQMLHGMAAEGLTGILHYWDTTLRTQLPGTVQYPAYPGYLSLFSLTEQCRDVTLRGVKYPLTRYLLRSTFPIGVSNEITGAAAEVSFTEGILLVVQVRESPFPAACI